jgi:chorismate mutase
MPLIAMVVSIMVQQANYDALLLEEQYNLEAQNCDSVACIRDNLAGLDEKILLLLGRRAALLRREVALSKSAGKAPYDAVDAADEVTQATEKASILAVPTPMARQTMAALAHASLRYVQALVAPSRSRP